LILSGVGAVSLWRGETLASSTARSARSQTDDVAEGHVAAVPVAMRERTAAPTSIGAEELTHDPATAHANDDVVAEHPAESGKSVADVLTSLEAAYRQGLVDGRGAG